MAGSDCCRYESSLDELIHDDVMVPVLRSAGLDAQGFRDMIVETARRFDRPPDEHRRTETSDAVCQGNGAKV